MNNADRSRARGASKVLRVLVSAGTAALVSACGASGPASPTATSSVVDQVDVADRKRVESFTGTLLDRTAFDSRDLAGRIVVYNVWGSWCAPCRTEAPALSRVSRDVAAKVSFVGINVRDNDPAARAFEARYAIEYPSITTDTSSGALLAFGPALPPSAVPSTMVVDPDGRLAARVIGPVAVDVLEGLLSDLMAETNATGRS